MKKPLRSLWHLLLKMLIALLGFTACKSAKKAQPITEQPVLYGPPPTIVEKMEPPH